MKRNRGKRLTSKDKNLLTNAVYAIVHFPIEQNLNATKTAYTENSSQFDHLFLWAYSVAHDPLMLMRGADIVKRQEKQQSKGQPGFISYFAGWLC